MYEFATEASGEFAALRLAILRLPPFPAAMASGAFVLDRAFRSISDICHADRRCNRSFLALLESRRLNLPFMRRSAAFEAFCEAVQFSLKSDANYTL